LSQLMPSNTAEAFSPAPTEAAELVPCPTPFVATLALALPTVELKVEPELDGIGAAVSGAELHAVKSASAENEPTRIRFISPPTTATAGAA
jgi:hypothetical protein